MESIFGEIKEGSKPRLLLHACCAPCSTAVLECLEKYFAITVFFYNPNLETEAEYNRRAEECKRLLKEMKLPISCTACFQLRLEETARFAQKWNAEHSDKPFDYYCTSLSISPLKNAALLNSLGEEIGEHYGIRFLPSDFKKKGRYLRSVELSKQYALYRQDYCGCEFSKAESLRRNQEKESIQ